MIALVTRKNIGGTAMNDEGRLIYPASFAAQEIPKQAKHTANIMIIYRLIEIYDFGIAVKIQ